MPQLAIIATHSVAAGNFSWPYQANVMNTFEQHSMMMGNTAAGENCMKGSGIDQLVPTLKTGEGMRWGVSDWLTMPARRVNDAAAGFPNPVGEGIKRERGEALRKGSNPRLPPQL